MTDPSHVIAELGKITGEAFLNELVRNGIEAEVVILARPCGHEHVVLLAMTQTSAAIRQMLERAYKILLTQTPDAEGEVEVNG